MTKVPGCQHESNDWSLVRLSQQGPLDSANLRG